MCPLHFLSLRHICPACEASVDPVRSEARYRQGIQPLCWNCGFDLRRTPVRRAEEADAIVTYEHFTALMHGDAGPGWPVGASLPEYFSIFLLLCTRLLLPNPRLQGWRDDAAKAAGVILPKLARRAVTSFSVLADPDLRRPFVRTASWLLEEWPARFLAHAKAENACPNDFVPRCARVPKWFLETLQIHLAAPKPALTLNPPSKSSLPEIPFEPMVKNT